MPLVAPTLVIAPHAAALDDLARGVARQVGPGEDLVTKVPGLSLHRRVRPTVAAPCLYAPSVTLAIAGHKQVRLGQETYLLAPGQFLLTSANLPVTPQVQHATAAHPYLALLYTLDLNALNTLLLHGDLPPIGRSAPSRAMAVGEASPELLDVFRRLVALLDTPRDVPLLAPLVEQELLYRLLMSNAGEQLRQMAAVGGQGHRITRAIRWLGVHYKAPLHVEALAAQVGMSTSAFHRAFKTVTGLSPLQYQKTLRLAEAQRLMLTMQMDAARAGFEVGYLSASQFSREYRRHFGAAPTSHVAALRQTA